MKINPHAMVMPFIDMIDPNERASIEDFDVRKHEQYNYLLLVGHIQQKHEGSLYENIQRPTSSNMPSAKFMWA